MSENIEESKIFLKSTEEQLAQNKISYDKQRGIIMLLILTDR